MESYNSRPVFIKCARRTVNPRPMDDFFTSDISLFATAEKATINGPKGVFDFKVKLPEHAGRIVSMYGKLMLLEMVQDLNDKGKAVLTLTRFSRYEGNGIFGSRFVAIKRNAFYDDEAKRMNANERLLNRWAAGCTKYDYKGLFAFFFKKYMPFIKHSQDLNKFYCSELCEDELNKDGMTYTDFPLKRRGLIAPFDMWNAKRVHQESGNAAEYYFL